MLKKILYGLFGLLLMLSAIMMFNMIQFESRQLDHVPETDRFIFNEREAIERFAESLRYETVSRTSGKVNEEAFQAFHDFLSKSFPLVFETLEMERINQWSLLYTWEGTNPDLDPALLLAHQDVVPAEHPDSWTHPPFSGHIDDNGVVWGRGAVDNKNGVMGILESVEALLEEGFQPERTIHLAFGHDEEVSGMYGARKMADLLNERGVRPAFVLDEGGYVTEGELPVDRPVAVVGTAEKGIVSFELVVSGRGGHSSMPPQQTAIGILSAAILALEENPFPASISGAARDLFDYVGPEMAFPERLMLSNLWLTETMVIRLFEGSPATNAMMRTTVAPTMMQGSDKDNIMPSEAKMVINVRIKPGKTVASVKESVRNIIDDERIEIRHHRDFYFDPSPVSNPDADAFRMIHQTIRQVYPESYVAPFLMVAATDARHYTDLSEQVYRFLPVHMNEAESTGFHAVDEQLRGEAYIKMIRFYRQLLINAAQVDWTRR